MRLLVIWSVINERLKKASVEVNIQCLTKLTIINALDGAESEEEFVWNTEDDALECSHSNFHTPMKRGEARSRHYY